ncbi:MAG: ABC transporter substrate-binding protein [Verrucomicrobiota bacterium]
MKPAFGGFMMAGFRLLFLGPKVGRWVCVAVAAFAVSCGEKESSDTGASVSDQTLEIKADWYAQPTHAGFYLASANGYYADAGLMVEVQSGSPNDNVRQLVAQGEIAFGVGRLEDIIMAIDRGLPLAVVGAYLQRIPLSLMVHADQEIYHVKDIGDRPVMATVGSLYLPRLEAKHGISFNTIPHMRTIARFISDKELVQQCYLTNEPYFVEKAGVVPRVLPLFDAAVDSFRVIYCRRSFAEANPEVVEKVVSLSHRGWAEYISEGDIFETAHRAIKERNPELDMEFMAWAREQMIAYGIVTGGDSDVAALRGIDRERVQEMCDELLDLELVKRRYDSEEIAVWSVIDRVLSKPIQSDET